VGVQSYDRNNCAWRKGGSESGKSRGVQRAAVCGGVYTAGGRGPVVDVGGASWW